MKACILYAGFFPFIPEFYFRFNWVSKKYLSNRFIMVAAKMAFAVLSNINEYAIKPKYCTVRYLFMAFRRYPL
jgi:hypothetical protein